MLLVATAADLKIEPALADVQKVLFVCVHGRVKQICPQFRASFRAPDGWTEDKIAESKQGRVIYVPKSKTYETALVAITALTAANKAKTSLETLIQRDQDAFRQANKGATIVPLAPIANDKIGAPVKLFKIIAPDTRPRGFMIQGRFADEDADGALFSVELTLSALTEKALAEARPKLDAMVKGY
jgi:hypothetical protein